MGIVIGPILKRADGYAFDTWTAGKGVSPGYPYRRIEDAHYARNATIKPFAQGRALAATVCQTLDEFIANSTRHEMLAGPDRACAAELLPCRGPLRASDTSHYAGFGTRSRRI